jgi:hypothetical protein
MFLDEELYLIVKNKKILTPTDFADLLQEMQEACLKRYTDNIAPGMRKLEVKSNIDRVFKSWDLVADKLKKEGYLFADELSKYNYKVQFMSNSNLKKIYDELTI